MITVGLVLGLGWALILPAVGEEYKAQQLDHAQKGMAEASWPKKPDDRLSPLSGKMKEHREISMRYYGEGQEFRAKSAGGWMKEASWARTPRWDGAAGRRWEEIRWEQGRDEVWSHEQNEKFQPQREVAGNQMLDYRKIESQKAPAWVSRSARTGSAGGEGMPKMYEGRLQRVRQQVWQKEEGRELGPERQEKFSPQEVEKMLAEPAERVRGAVRAQSPAASPLAVAGN